MQKMMPKLLNSKQAAQVLNVNRTRFCDVVPYLAQAGVLPVKLPGRRKKYWRVADIDKFIANLQPHEEAL